MDDPLSVPVRRPLAALSGIVAALFGLAIAQLTTALDRRFRSPVLDVGDRIIDRVPAWLKNLAIDWFGTADKIVLLGTIGALLAVYAAILGVAALRGRLAVALVGVGLFGAVGIWAATSGRTDQSAIVIIPTIVGAIGAGAALVALRRLSERPLAVGDDVIASTFDADSSGLRRRQVLLGLGATAVAGALSGIVGFVGAARFSASESRVALTARSVFSRVLPTVDSKVLAPVDGIRPFITPNDDFYRIDTALQVPQVPVDSWSLSIGGMVDNPVTLTFDDLLAREVIDSTITLTCVSNEIGGTLLGTAQWTGIRLDDLLAEVGVQPGADQIVGRSVDGYTCGFPTSVLDGRDALVAIGMNGEPLPIVHGFPARLIVPGLYGYVSATKWLSEIELTTFDEFDQYWVPRGWDNQAPIKTQSRIDTPRPLSTVAPGKVAIAGTAWAQIRGIDRVEVRVDDGDWVEAELAESLNDVTWRQWFFEWDATSGSHTITVRATDSTGETQTAERQRPMPNGATGHHEIVVLVS